APPAMSTYRALHVEDGRGVVERSLHVSAPSGDLVGELMAPRAVAKAIAEHDDPRPPPDETELALANCIVNNHEAPGCPDFRLPTHDAALALEAPPDGVARIVWHDGNVEVALPLATVLARLKEVSEDDWDERRGEWARARLHHVQALVQSGKTPWLSSLLEGHGRDVRMDELVRAALSEGHAEIHKCSGPPLPYVLRYAVTTGSGETTVYRLPDGAFLFPAPS
ncbi:MAG: hypothetical protein AAF721_40005, partial [Myxococcota bacterium]